MAMKPKFWKRKSVKITSLVIGFLLLVALAWIFSTYSLASKIFTTNFGGGSLFKLLTNGLSPLKGQSDGRVNILLLGYGGAGHDGAFLTDSIQVVSLDTKNNKMAMISIPRDFYIEVKKPSYSGKINAVYETKSNGKLANTIDGCNPDLIKNEISSVLGIPIHYYVSLNFAGFKKAVDEIGGIDLTVDRSFTDYEYPADTGDGFLPSQSFKAGEQHMNGTKALIFARSRHAAGAEGSDFARSARQQKVLVAFKSKLMSQGFLDNSTKISSFVNILSSSLRTDLKPDEVKALASLIKTSDTANIISKVLGSSQDGLLSQMPGTSSYQPEAGVNNFSQIQQLARNIFNEQSSAKKDARIEVLNGSSTAGLAANLAELLKSYGYNIVKIDKTSIIPTTIIYDYSAGAKADTLNFLKSALDASVVVKTKPSGATSDIVVIVGNNYQEKSVNIQESIRKQSNS